MFDKCDIFLSPLVTRCLPSHTSCQHIAGIFPASSSRKPKLGPISTFCPVWKSLPAGCRTPSELTRSTAGRLLEARDRRNCFGTDARGCWLFPGQGQLVPTRARHTPAFAHFYSLRTNTRWLSMKTLLSNKTLPLVKIHFCTQETFVVLLYFLKKPAVCMCPLINVGQKSKFLGELPGSDVMADVAGHKPAWEATVSQRAGYGALPTGRGWPPPKPTCCCCCCPTLVTLQPAVRQTSSQKLQPLLWREKQVLHPHRLIAVGWTFDRCGF